MLIEPVRVEVTPQVVTVDKIRQHVHFVAAADKRGRLIELLRDPVLARVIVFTRTKHGANKVAGVLDRAEVPAEAIHGNKSQRARQRALERFRAGEVRVLVATDIAARGIDVDGITHVVNYEIPNVPETYVHRIGRTARAGAEGTAISLCDPSERAYLRDIERLTRRPIAAAEGAPAESSARRLPPAGAAAAPKRAPGAPQARRPAPARASRQGPAGDWHRRFAQSLNRGFAGAR
jgi:ATP-dependent RNA helicase RhlE